MSTTAQDIITDGLQQLKVYAPGQSVRDVDLKIGLTKLNSLLEFLSNESAACFAILEQSLVLTPNKATYTIGPGGDVNGTRPIRLIYGPGAAYVKDNNGVKYNLDVWPQDKWNQLAFTNQTADFPTVLFYDPQYPLGNLNFYPTPTQAFTAYFDSYLQLASLASYTTALSLPPGYEAMLRWNLPIWLKTYWKSKPLDPLIEKMAMRTLNAVKRSNRRQNIAEYDPEILERGTASYNIYNDSYTR